MASQRPSPGGLGQARADGPSPRPGFDRARLVELALAYRSSLVRLLGVALITYGAVGLVAMLYGYGLVRQTFAITRDVGLLAPAEKSNALRGLESISATLADASSASSNLTNSLSESQASLRTGSIVATDVAASFRQLAETAGFQIYGIQPLADLVQPFVDSSVRLEVLSQDLSRTSAAVGVNATDSQRLSADFNRLKIEVDGLAMTVARLPTDPTSGGYTQRLEKGLAAILVWISLQALACFVAGLAILAVPPARLRSPPTFMHER